MTLVESVGGAISRAQARHGAGRGGPVFPRMHADRLRLLQCRWSAGCRTGARAAADHARLQHCVFRQRRDLADGADRRHCLVRTSRRVLTGSPDPASRWRGRSPRRSIRRNARAWRLRSSISAAFVASGILQPLVGWVVDHGAGVVAGGSGDAYWLGIGVIVGWMLIAIVAATRLTETRCRNVWSPAGCRARLSRAPCDNLALPSHRDGKERHEKPRILVTREVFDETHCLPRRALRGRCQPGRRAVDAGAARATPRRMRRR